MAGAVECICAGRTGMRVMLRLMLAVCGLILGTGLVFAQDLRKMQGVGTATKADRNAAPADDLVGYQLSVAENRFQIVAKDGKPLYAGTVRLEPNHLAKGITLLRRQLPSAIDFNHTEGGLKGKRWEG